MIALIAGLVVFLGVHLIPTRPDLRGRLQGALGAWGYKGLFSMVAAVGETWRASSSRQAALEVLHLVAEGELHPTLVDPPKTQKSMGMVSAERSGG